MRANIGELLADRCAIRAFAYSERVESPAEDIALLTPARGELLLANTGRTVSLTGRVRTVLSLVCEACLVRYEQPLEFAIVEEFGRTASPGVTPSRGESELGQEDFVVPVGPDDEIDITEVVRQHLVLALPFAPRCREACRGLCATCGVDLNLGSCGCPGNDRDLRFQVLKHWPTGPRE